jgi:hypothetical protein
MEKKRLSFNDRKADIELVAITFLSAFSDIKELFPYVVFQGGNALRFCYNSPRYSNDLDFVTEKKLSFDPEKVRSSIQAKLSKIFSNRITVKYHHVEGSILHTFSVSVYPKNKATRKIEVKLEIAEGIPAFTHTYTPARSKYSTLNIILKVEEEQEILADKLVAIGNRPIRKTMPFKSRDIWDIYWLMGMRVKVDKELVMQKLKYYDIDFETFKQVFTERVNSMDSEESFVFFKNEMDRYMDLNEIKVTDDLYKEVLSTARKKLMQLDFYEAKEEVAVEGR